MESSIPPILAHQNGVARTQRWYQPSKIFSVRGNIHTFDNGSSYTAITPHTEVAGHVITRFQPFKKVSLQDDVNRHQR